MFNMCLHVCFVPYQNWQIYSPLLKNRVIDLFILQIFWLTSPRQSILECFCSNKITSTNLHLPLISYCWIIIRSQANITQSKQCRSANPPHYMRYMLYCFKTEKALWMHYHHHVSRNKTHLSSRFICNIHIHTHFNSFRSTKFWPSNQHKFELIYNLA